jgi:hypothetical protein
MLDPKRSRYRYRQQIARLSTVPSRGTIGAIRATRTSLPRSPWALAPTRIAASGPASSPTPEHAGASAVATAAHTRLERLPVLSAVPAQCKASRAQNKAQKKLLAEYQ